MISGRTEAQLTAGAVVDLDPRQGPFVVADLGGGSTEIVVGEYDDDGDPRILGARSLDIGCMRITERTLHSDLPSSGEIVQVRALIAQDLESETVVLDNIWKIFTRSEGGCSSGFRGFA